MAARKRLSVEAIAEEDITPLFKNVNEGI